MIENGTEKYLDLADVFFNYGSGKTMIIEDALAFLQEKAAHVNMPVMLKMKVPGRQ